MYTTPIHSVSRSSMFTVHEALLIPTSMYISTCRNKLTIHIYIYIYLPVHAMKLDANFFPFHIRSDLSPLVSH